MNSSRDPDHPYTTCRYRSPRAVSEAIRDLIQDKVVCELGCSSGDNMVFMEQYAKKVIGTEIAPDRYQVAKDRGLDVMPSDYWKDNIPSADVYYFWPSKAVRDDEYLMEKILAIPSFKGTIIIAGDSNAPAKYHEVPTVLKCAEKRGGQVLRVPYNEGKGNRMSGTMVLAIIRVS